jgi:hypothetical protein
MEVTILKTQCQSAQQHPGMSQQWSWIVHSPVRITRLSKLEFKLSRQLRARIAEQKEKIDSKQHEIDVHQAWIQARALLKQMNEPSMNQTKGVLVSGLVMSVLQLNPEILIQQKLCLSWNADWSYIWDMQQMDPDPAWTRPTAEHRSAFDEDVMGWICDGKSASMEGLSDDWILQSMHPDSDLICSMEEDDGCTMGLCRRNGVAVLYRSTHASQLKQRW